MNFTIASAEHSLGEERPHTHSYDITGCPECKTIYRPGTTTGGKCPKCLAKGHIYRTISRAEAMWWAKAYRWWVEQGSTFHQVSVKKHETLAQHLHLAETQAATPRIDPSTFPHRLYLNVHLASALRAHFDAAGIAFEEFVPSQVRLGDLTHPDKRIWGIHETDTVKIADAVYAAGYGVCLPHGSVHARPAMGPGDYDYSGCPTCDKRIGGDW